MINHEQLVNHLLQVLLDILMGRISDRKLNRKINDEGKLRRGRARLMLISVDRV